MEEKRNLMLPGNPRYQPRELKEIFGYDNLYQGVARVEIATLEVLGEIGAISPEELKLITGEIVKKIITIPTTEVDIVERKITKHDIRAWVRKAQEIIDPALARWVHVPLTSYDPLDTGRMLQFRDAYKLAIRPSIAEVIGDLADLTEKYANEVQIGRTHGQHALPITVGFWLATILERLVENWERIDYYHYDLVGKISGAVGAHNAQIGIGFNDLALQKKGMTFEELVLEKLDLIPARISTQILPPEPLAFFLFSCVTFSATLGQFGRDCRHLMRSEIAEITESFEEGQVGSSTMAHKRNPINFESLEGMWLRTKNEFGKVLDTLISEHQRDLVGSSVARDFPIILVNLQNQLNTLRKKNEKGVSFLQRISVNREACRDNFKKNANVILAEPLYIALQMAGYESDAHELVNHTLVPMAKERGISLMQALVDSIAVDGTYVDSALIEKIPKEVRELLANPSYYIGDAKEKAIEIAKHARKISAEIMKR